MRAPTEHDHQKALFEAAARLSPQYPELNMLYAVPNGGHRHIAVARKLKAEGVKAGVPDVCLPVPKGSYHGFYAELKVGKNKPTKKQYEWIKALRSYGYFAKWYNGWEDLWNDLMAYILIKG